MSLRVTPIPWQAVTIFFLSVAEISAADAPKTFAWNPPKVTHSQFSSELGMLDSERDAYATNLADQAAKQVVTAQASPESLADARRMIAVAFHLSPRNKRAIVVNFQLSKSLLPEISEGNYSPQVLARLLLSRGQLLEKQGGDENKRLARCFVQLASNMDPKNDDAVYASEIHRLDRGPLDWSTITDCPEKKPEPSEPAMPNPPAPRRPMPP
jgi:hypothetical protein